MDDGEGFLMTDWGEAVRTVQFHRKETFDAGATPGLEDFERPDLRSVSDDLVDELQTISEQQAAREDEIARLENELEEREQRIAELDPVARRMLASYRDAGVATPEALHEVAGESGDRPVAYSHNRALRREGFVVHVGRGRYAYSLPSLVAAQTDVDLDDDRRRQLVGEVEAALNW
jgi:hypothetical protein